MDAVGALTAFSGGLLSFFSPCILPLIPAYLCFITGLSAGELNENDIKKSVIRRIVLTESVLFVLGFSSIFVIMGASATLLGSFFYSNKRLIEIIGGFIVILFGLHISGLLNIRFLQFERKMHLEKKPTNMFGSFLVGAAFGFGWSPCVGPILGGILMMASTGDSVYEGISLLSLYSLGLAIPFLLMGLGAGWSLGFFSKIKRHLKTVSIVSGVFLVCIGLLLIVRGGV